jgi:hypothetical protein
MNPALGCGANRYVVSEPATGIRFPWADDADAAWYSPRIARLPAAPDSAVAGCLRRLSAAAASSPWSISGGADRDGTVSAKVHVSRRRTRGRPYLAPSRQRRRWSFGRRPLR